MILSENMIPLFGIMLLIVKIARLKLDWRAVRGAFAGMFPGIAGARQLLGAGEPLRGDDTLERIEPVMIVGLAGVRIAGGLRLLDLLPDRRRPFGPREHAARVERQRQ